MREYAQMQYFHTEKYGGFLFVFLLKNNFCRFYSKNILSYVMPQKVSVAPPVGGAFVSSLDQKLSFLIQRFQHLTN